jgi:hypothetical protein
MDKMDTQKKHFEKKIRFGQNGQNGQAKKRTLKNNSVLDKMDKME